MSGDAVAVVETTRSLTYRELNQRANAVARRLIAHGFRRGRHAFVVMPLGVDLAVMLLAVLKVGGCYSWIDGQGGCSPYPTGVSISLGREEGQEKYQEEKYQYVDVTCCLRAPTQASPNLPVLTRGSDTACVLMDREGAAAIRVSHDTVVSFGQHAGEAATTAIDSGAFAMWMVLMTGRTVTLEPSIQVAAA